VNPGGGGTGPGDTERPPAPSGPAFSPEPPSGVAQTAPAPALGDATRVAPLPDPRRPPLPAAAPPPPPRVQPSSNRMPAARANTQPQVSSPTQPQGFKPTGSSARMPVAKPRTGMGPPTPAGAFAPVRAPAVTGPQLQGTTVGHAPPPDVIAAIEAGEQVAEAEPAKVPLTRRCTTCDERYPGDFLVCPRDATPLTDETGEHQVDPLLGKLLGETYQIVRVVGEGGMGRVYEARHLRLKQRRYAVKTLHAELARNVEMAARFMREAESVSGLDHPNVVDVFDVHHLPDGTPYLVGEFLEGEELADYVEKRGKLEPFLAANVARQVCAALGAAHANGIVHRDMKPENIFVLKSSIDTLATGESKNLSVKVLDFGISKSGGKERTHLTKTGVIMGTPSYMSPEQARGKQVDHRADVYSVGACLYYMITAVRPFDSDDPTSTISMVLTQDPQRPREIDERIPEGLELIVQRAMAKDPRERYQTMAELERALEGFVKSGRPISSQPLQVFVPEIDPKESGAMRAFDLAKAALGSPSIAPAAAGAVASSEAKLARPTIVGASVALGFWFVGGTATALGGLVRVLHDGEITVTESVLLLVGCLFASATPMGLYVAHVKKKIWPNSVRAVQLATDLRRFVFVAFVSFGALTLLNRLAHTIFLRSSHKLASGIWDMALFAVSVVVAFTIGGFAPLVRNMRRRRSSESS
jgi:serine/threonine protein kinase